MDLLEPLLDSWRRSNTILTNLLLAIPVAALELRPAPNSPSIAGVFLHIHYTRLWFLSEDTPDFAAPPHPTAEDFAELNPNRIAERLKQSAQLINDAVRHYLEADLSCRTHFDHPLIFLQHMIWHDAYHHGQIKLTLKLAGQPLDDEAIGPLTWDIFIDKSVVHPTSD